MFRGCKNLGASAIRRPLTCPLSAEWPGALAQRCGADVVEVDLTYQVSKTFESQRHIMTLADLYNTKEGEEVVVHRSSWRKQGEQINGLHGMRLSLSLSLSLSVRVYVCAFV